MTFQTKVNGQWRIRLCLEGQSHGRPRERSSSKQGEKQFRMDVSTIGIIQRERARIGKEIGLIKRHRHLQNPNGIYA